MTQKILLTAALLSIFSSMAISQTDTTSAKSANDSSLFNSGNYIAKKGYSLAPLPEFMIDPFIGLYLGVYSTIFDYGDGKIYPNYYRSLTIAAAHGTKGKTNFGLEYLDYGKFLLSAKPSYTISTMYPFFGYNGYQTRYNANYTDDSKPEYITGPFYNYHQKVARLALFIQDTIKGTYFNWQVGTDLAFYETGRVHFDKLNKGVDEPDKIPDVPTLYDRYVQWGIIGDKEKDGGWANALRTALVYDHRDRLTNPMQGLWTDLTLRYSPSFLGNEHSALQIAFTHRHYITLIREKLSFAYRLRYDASFGKLPFYTRQIMADGIEGIGGTTSIWGMHQNRVMASQFAMVNIELRAKLVRFRFIKQNWYVAAVPLFHTGYLVKKIDMDLAQVSADDKEKYFTQTNNPWYSTYGIGAKLVMNENTVIGFDWAHAINDQAGNNAVYIGFGYSF